MLGLGPIGLGEGKGVGLFGCKGFEKVPFRVPV